MTDRIGWLTKDGGERLIPLAKKLEIDGGSRPTNRELDCRFELAGPQQSEARDQQPAARNSTMADPKKFQIDSLPLPSRTASGTVPHLLRPSATPEGRAPAAHVQTRPVAHLGPEMPSTFATAEPPINQRHRLT